MQISTKAEEDFVFISTLIILSCLYYFEFQGDKEYDFDIKEDIDYFPVIQGDKGTSATLTKP